MTAKRFGCWGSFVLHGKGGLQSAAGFGQSEGEFFVEEDWLVHLLGITDWVGLEFEIEFELSG